MEEEEKKKKGKASLRDGIKLKRWKPEEDNKLKKYIDKHGVGNWEKVPRREGLKRSPDACRLRYTNYLANPIESGFTDEEDDIIIKLQSLIGNEWSRIAKSLPRRRTGNTIKNYCKTEAMKKKLEKTKSSEASTRHLQNPIPSLGLERLNSDDIKLLDWGEIHDWAHFMD